jgi:hypothetical protein
LCCLFVITMVFATLLCLGQAVFRLDVFSIVVFVCHYNGVHYFTLSWSSCLLNTSNLKTAWSGQSKVVNTIVMTNRQHNTKYYLVLCCLFVITMVFTTLLCLGQAVFRLEVFSIVLFVCHYKRQFDQDKVK